MTQFAYPDPVAYPNGYASPTPIRTWIIREADGCEHGPYESDELPAGVVAIEPPATDRVAGARRTVAID